MSCPHRLIPGVQNSILLQWRAIIYMYKLPTKEAASRPTNCCHLGCRVISGFETGQLVSDHRPRQRLSPLTVAQTQAGGLPNLCPICWETLDQDSSYRRLPCGHIFHLPCINCWLCDEDASCPLCRRKFYYLRRPRLIYIPKSHSAVVDHHLPRNLSFRAVKMWFVLRFHRIRF